MRRRTAASTADDARTRARVFRNGCVTTWGRWRRWRDPSCAQAIARGGAMSEASSEPRSDSITARFCDQVRRELDVPSGEGSSLPSAQEVSWPAMRVGSMYVRVDQGSASGGGPGVAFVRCRYSQRVVRRLGHQPQARQAMRYLRLFAVEQEATTSHNFSARSPCGQTHKQRCAIYLGMDISGDHHVSVPRRPGSARGCSISAPGW